MPASQPTIFEKLRWRSCYVMLAQVPWSSSSPRRPPCGSWPRCIQSFQDFHKHKENKKFKKIMCKTFAISTTRYDRSYLRLVPSQSRSLWLGPHLHQNHWKLLKIIPKHAVLRQDVLCGNVQHIDCNILQPSMQPRGKSPAFCNVVMPFHSSSFHSHFHMSFLHACILPNIYIYIISYNESCMQYEIQQIYNIPYMIYRAIYNIRNSIYIYNMINIYWYLLLIKNIKCILHKISHIVYWNIKRYNAWYVVFFKKAVIHTI